MQRPRLVGILAAMLPAVVLVFVPSPWRWPAIGVLVIGGIIGLFLSTAQRAPRARVNARRDDDGGSPIFYGAGSHSSGGKHKSPADSSSDSHGSSDSGGGDAGGGGGGD